MSLPPGRYLLNAYMQRDDGSERAEVILDREIHPTAKISDIELGALRFSPFEPLPQERIVRAA